MEQKKRALVIGSSGGIGAATASEFEQMGWAVTRLSRRDDGLDVSDPESVANALGNLEGPFDRIVIATGKLDGAGHPPEKSLAALTAEAMADQFAINAIGPALILQHIENLLPRDRPSKVVVLTARVGSIGDNRLGGWYSYRAAKAAANQIVHGAAIELARKFKQSCVYAYHPGTVATPFTADYQGSHKSMPPAVAAKHLVEVMEARSPEDTGKFYDWRGDIVAW
ncbi:SDR family NAD(P)-dependent oxidoreductase [Celeribacter arenosi]